MRTAGRLSMSIDALAALAAQLRVETEGLEVDPEVGTILSQVTAELGEFDDAPEAVRRAVIGMARAFLHQAVDLIDNPGRAGGWTEPGEALLQGLGRLSAAIVDAFRSAAGVLDGLEQRLDSSGARFLDVGTGTGWLAIATAQAYPKLEVVGIDVFEPALSMARRNVAVVGIDDRVDLRLQDAADLAPDDRYDVIWLPLPFLPIEVVPRILDSCGRALRPGGWLLPGTFAASADRLSELLVELRTVRSGGYHWQTAELIEMVNDHGYVDACEVPRTWAAPVRLYAGRKV